MNRHPRLQPLSREHHHALVLARRAVRWSQESSERREAGWSTVRESYERELLPHFRNEEEEILPLVASSHEALVLRVQAEHERMRQLVRKGTSSSELCEFGELLREHVRLEERHLFPAVEAALFGGA